MSRLPTDKSRPRSATSGWVCLISAITLIGCVSILRRLEMRPSTVFFAGMGSLVGVQIALEIFVRKVHLRPSSGLVFRADHFRANFSISRSLVKLGGFYATLAVLAVIYLLIPMYSTDFHRPFWQILRILAPYLVVLSIPYFILIDALMADPKDGYWHAAQLFALRFKHVDRAVLKEYVMGWLIKGFYLPLMTPFLFAAMRGFAGQSLDWSMVTLVFYATALALFIDLAFVVVGYAFTVRILDSHIRSANPFLFGWVACLVLYRPFWTTAGLRYDDGTPWYQWLESSSNLLICWGVLIILAKLGWAWANMVFGFRFSNLTHRGIITGGPYRFTKHPSYIFKNVGWWLINVPFLSAAGTVPAIQYTLALLGVNLLYFVRAKSEEMHLSEDPTYVAYAEWINEHGALRWLGRVIPWLRYRAPVNPRRT